MISTESITQQLSHVSHNIDNTSINLPVVGSLVRMVGLTLEAVGVRAKIGARCLISLGSEDFIEAEVVGFEADKTYLMPIGKPDGLMPGAKVIPTSTDMSVPVGNTLLGRVIDGLGNPLDGKGSVVCDGSQPLHATPINPLERSPITEVLDVGIRAINGLLTIGKGQRIGLFAGSGVGKSVLLGMMTRYTSADVIVVGLIGERGREVKEFVEQILGPQGLARAVVVATPADNPPLLKLHGAQWATAIAEYYREQGLDVLLLMDSLTRYAQAQREIALAIGEPPATKGYPPSVFSMLPELVERTGNGRSGKGSITAFYTVLTEGDDQQDPIADSARAILDGHIVLSRALAERGHYPAIDIEASISRVMPQVVQKTQIEAAISFKKHYATYYKNEDLMNVGAYKPGTQADIDAAIKLLPTLNQYLEQGLDEAVSFEQSKQGLERIQ